MKLQQFIFFLQQMKFLQQFMLKAHTQEGISPIGPSPDLQQGNCMVRSPPHRLQISTKGPSSPFDHLNLLQLRNGYLGMTEGRANLIYQPKQTVLLCCLHEPLNLTMYHVS